jgi:hypothetical protein
MEGTNYDVYAPDGAILEVCRGPHMNGCRMKVLAFSLAVRSFAILCILFFVLFGFAQTAPKSAVPAKSKALVKGKRQRNTGYFRVEIRGCARTRRSV